MVPTERNNELGCRVLSFLWKGPELEKGPECIRPGTEVTSPSICRNRDTPGCETVELRLAPSRGAALFVSPDRKVWDINVEHVRASEGRHMSCDTGAYVPSHLLRFRNGKASVPPSVAPDVVKPQNS